MDELTHFPDQESYYTFIENVVKIYPDHPSGAITNGILATFKSTSTGLTQQTTLHYDNKNKITLPNGTTLTAPVAPETIIRNTNQKINRRARDDTLAFLALQKDIEQCQHEYNHIHGLPTKQD